MNNAQNPALGLLRRSVENSAAAANNAQLSNPDYFGLDGQGVSIAGGKRQRADTMPSRPTTSLLSAAAGVHQQQQQQQQHSHQPISNPPVLAPNSRPSLTQNPTPRKPSPLSISTRFRSGSLTLPSASLSKAFGPSIFAWSERDTNAVLSPTTPGGELNEESANSIARTLGVLGLDDPMSPRPKLSPGSTLPEFSVTPSPKEDASASSTVATSANPLLRAKLSHLNRVRSLSTSATNKYDDEYVEGGENKEWAGQAGAYSQLNAGGLIHPNMGVHRLHQALLRPRAISVGVLDSPSSPTYPETGPNPGATSPPTSDAYASFMPDTDSVNMLSGNEILGLLVNGVIDGKPLKASPLNTNSVFPSRESSPLLGDPFGSPGAYMGSLAGNAPAPNVFGTSQIPSRTLWVGNLDPTLSTADLRQIFMSLGPVESLKLLPDRECGFVNFTTVEDAVRARDEILHRLGGRIGKCAVRLGFGKAEHNSPAETPTRALWIGNIPATTTTEQLQEVFAAFGPVESARVLTHKNCGFVNFERMEDAVMAKRTIQGRELFGVSGSALRIGFAKEPPPMPSPILGQSLPGAVGGLESGERNGKAAGPSPMRSAEAYQASVQMLVAGLDHVESLERERRAIYRELAIEGEDRVGSPSACEEEPNPAEPVVYHASIPSVPDPNPHRRVDAARLREMRKRLDMQHVTQKEIETIATECMEDIVELCSDYIGNTVVQRLFEKCSEPLKLMMLEKIAPYLAMIGIHKNGTWAAQKIIECTNAPEQVNLISTHLRPYAPALMLDQFGNYVVQCTLKFGPEWNQYAFDAMVDRTWEIAQGRFGARAMRTCLESQYATVKQKKQVAAALIQHALLMITNPNGALLLTWLLDTSALSGRYRLLAPRLLPHLAYFCMHKLASLTILKLLSQEHELEARDLLISALFNSPGDKSLAEVLCDQVHGVGVVHKALTLYPNGTEAKRRMAMQIKQLLVQQNVQHLQGYKRLLEEIHGLLQHAPVLGAAPTTTAAAAKPAEMHSHLGYLAIPREGANSPQPQPMPQLRSPTLATSFPPPASVPMAESYGYAAPPPPMGALPHYQPYPQPPQAQPHLAPASQPLQGGLYAGQPAGYFIPTYNGITPPMTPLPLHHHKPHSAPAQHPHPPSLTQQPPVGKGEKGWHPTPPSSSPSSITSLVEEDAS
ncbi:uncharacterized protein VTP21DRAFT_3436 [Calcarisporiella thermophila]|uniref:uncharacterized protein n=1 Tax=Calcarisporiella thermophila TaxID=911321 RepID=UPI003743E0B1